MIAMKERYPIFRASGTKVVTTASHFLLLLILTAVAVLATTGYNDESSNGKVQYESCRASTNNNCATTTEQSSASSSPKSRPSADNDDDNNPHFDFFGDIVPDDDNAVVVDLPPDDDDDDDDRFSNEKETIENDNYDKGVKSGFQYKKRNDSDEDDDIIGYENEDYVYDYDDEEKKDDNYDYDDNDKTTKGVERKKKGVEKNDFDDDDDDEGGGGVVDDSTTDDDNDVEEEEEPVCEDLVEYCDALVKRGECKNNLAFMHEKCQSSCKMCTKNFEDCYDDDDDCPEWAERGECVKKRDYMLENCRESCGVCMTDEICQDYHDYCPIWAESGECEKDPGFMFHSCKKSCNICIGNKAIDLGVIQILTGDKDEARHYLHESLNYLTSKILPDDDLFDVHHLCTNTYTNCVDLAVKGECKIDSLYEDILTDCPLACQSCKMLHEAIRCGYDPDAEGFLDAGELNLYFERDILGNLESLKFLPRVLSRPYLSETPETNASYQISAPWVISYDSFLTDDECDRLVALGTKQGYEDSKVVGDELVEGDRADEFGEERKSKQTWCDATCERDAITQRVMKRVSDVTGISVNNQESFQLLKYDEGDYYLLHGDFIYENKYYVPGPRILTLYFYLNDDFEGGETLFSDLGIKITPKKGKAILWPNALNENLFERNPLTDHEALPVTRGVKYGANLWIHLRDYKNPETNGCS